MKKLSYVFILISNKKARELISSHIKSRFYLCFDIIFISKGEVITLHPLNISFIEL